MYACVVCAEAEVNDICGSELEILGQFGYIKTPHYPANYPDNVDCNVTVRTPHAEQRVELHIIDLTLEQEHTGCADWLEIFDGHRSKTMCGTRSRQVAFTSITNVVTVKFRSSSTEQRKGFWLMYKGRRRRGYRFTPEGVVQTIDSRRFVSKSARD